jgi:hypothetical protein
LVCERGFTHHFQEPFIEAANLVCPHAAPTGDFGQSFSLIPDNLAVFRGNGKCFKVFGGCRVTDIARTDEEA